MKKPIEAGIMARAMNALGAARDAWFGPGEPMQPMVTGAQAESVQGRQFDFGVAFNRIVTPRSTEATSYAQLRQLADACDVLRVVIETRKDQMAKMKWNVKPLDEKKEPDARCAQLQAFLQFPDQEHDWDTWLRMLLEEVFVTDAPAVYIRKTLGGGVYSLDPLDGSTIKRVLDEHGRTPIAPDPAYQQVLKGMPVTNYSTDQLIYRPRNQRVWKVYGYSPVEQILMTVNTALRRSVHVMQVYTEGNIPEALMGVPATWSTAQIKEFQTHWDSLMENNTASKRKMKFVPGDMKFQPTKEPVMKDEFDEWLARVVCFAFSISPTPFVKQVNRATAETAQDAALMEGLAPIMQWVLTTMNLIIQRHFGYTDLQFAWNIEEEQDPLVKAGIDKIYLDARVITPDEVRADLGMPPLTPEQVELLKPPPPPVPFGGPDNLTNENAPPGETKPDDKVAKAKKTQPGRIDPDRAGIVKLEKKLSKAVGAFLKSRADNIGKADDEITATVSIDWDELVPIVQPILEEIATSGARAALKQIGEDDADVVFGPRVSQWAADRAAEMVGKKWVDGELVDNPSAEWVITDSTRDAIQALVTQATDEGLTMDELSDLIRESTAFSEERADMIARTETRLADSAGQMDAYVESGVVEGTEWSTSQDDAVSDECLLNEAAGVIPLGEMYPSGDAAPPSHPNCRCCLVAALLPREEN